MSWRLSIMSNMSNNGFNCPFCSSVFPKTDSCYIVRTLCFKYQDPNSIAFRYSESLETFEQTPDAIAVEFALCPACNRHSIKIVGVGSEVKGIETNFSPSSLAIKFPDYIPQSIRVDYEEACKIVNLSPKASATLSRRCLQGMIRDYWEVSGKKNLFEEINAIHDKIDPQVKQVLTGVRQLGNIGAHMEKDINLIVDIDPNESSQLIKLIEYLMEQWYIKRYETEELMKSILNINNDKQQQRNV